MLNVFKSLSVTKDGKECCQIEIKEADNKTDRDCCKEAKTCC
ncbi:hypothetical protein [Bacillus sp. ISL-47]|nr:hypothetical protein [Bacillus sp. ISL-47]